MKISRYRKIPVVIEAVRWDGHPEMASGIVKWMQEQGQEAQFISVPGLTHSISIVTLEGVMYATSGDWIIRGVEGRVLPV